MMRQTLSSWAMTQYLPYGGYELLSQEEIENFDVNSIGENSSDGYILEVHLESPDELHDFQNYFSLAPEKLEVSNDMLSKYCSEIAEKYRIKVGGIKKLVPNLSNKSQCVVHYSNLQLYLSIGIKLTKVQRILKFQ